MQKNIFRGDLTDNSAKKEALVVSQIAGDVALIELHVHLDVLSHYCLFDCASYHTTRPCRLHAFASFQHASYHATRPFVLYKFDSFSS